MKKKKTTNPDKETRHLIESMQTLSKSFQSCGLKYSAMICDLTAKKLSGMKKK